MNPIETDTSLTYSFPDGSTIILTKDASNLDVREIVPVAIAGQAWTDMKTYLDAKLAGG